MIRPCRDGDLPRISEIINDAASAYKGAIPEDCWREPYMPMEELRQEAAAMTFYGLEEGDRLVGVVGYQPLGDVTLLRHIIGLTTTRRLLVGMWADAAWTIRFYAKHGFSLEPDGDRLLRTYWTIPDRQREASIVMGRRI